MSQWDERFGGAAFVYGTEPNRWLASRASSIVPRGRVLSLGEGEGRNAVWLAQQGFQVEAVDGSAVGLEKAQRLAAERGIAIRTRLLDLAQFQPDPDPFDAVVLIFLHLAPSLRKAVHLAAVQSLRPGGAVIMEAFNSAQVKFASGGPRQPEMLYTVDLLRSDFPGVTWDVLDEVEADLDEGPLHRGRAALVHGLGRRQG